MPHAMIARLEQEIYPHTLATHHHLKHTFFTLKIEPLETISKFILRIDEYSDRVNKAIRFRQITHPNQDIIFFSSHLIFKDNVISDEKEKMILIIQDTIQNFSTSEPSSMKDINFITEDDKLYKYNN